MATRTATRTASTRTTGGRKAPRSRSTGAKTSTLVAAAEAAFEQVRKNFPDLKKAEAPMFLIQSEKRTDKLGHFAAGRWTDIATTNGQRRKQRHEIALVAEQFKNRKPEDVFETILHESAHALAHVRGVKDCSSNGRYHNAKFREIAEEVGLVTSFSEQYGHAFTAMAPETKKRYRVQIAALGKALKMYRITETGKSKPVDRNYVKGTCSNCGIVVRASKQTIENVFSTAGGWPCPICSIYDEPGVFEFDGV